MPPTPNGVPPWIQALPCEQGLILGFWDLTDYLSAARARAPLELLDLMSGYFALCAEIVTDSGGGFVKAIDDAGLAVFPASIPDDAVTAFMRLRRDGDGWLAARDVAMRAQVALHARPVACGIVANRFDVYGTTVNEAALLLKTGPFVISPALHALLGDAQRRLFIATETGPFVPVR